MTRKEAMRLTHQENTLMSLGFTREESEALRRISMTLHRWAEHECNGDIERDEDTGLPYRSFAGRGGKHHAYRIPDKEKGATARLEGIVSARNKRAVSPGSHNTAVGYYIQGDPRGCALYILRHGDVPPGGDVHGYYSRGIAVY